MDLQEQSNGKAIAFCATRGAPGNYGGSETTVDEISRRFVKGTTNVRCSAADPLFGNQMPKGPENGLSSA